MSPAPLRLGSTGKVAGLLNLSPDTVRRLILAGELAAFKVGRQYLVDMDSLPALLERSRVRPEQAHLKISP